MIVYSLFTIEEVELRLERCYETLSKGFINLHIYFISEGFAKKILHENSEKSIKKLALRCFLRLRLGRNSVAG